MFIIEGEGGDQTFILPLGKCETDGECNDNDDDDDNYEDNDNDNDGTLPFACGATLPRRWELLEDVLSNSQIKVVTFNAALAYLPIHFRR